MLVNANNPRRTLPGSATLICEIRQQSQALEPKRVLMYPQIRICPELIRRVPATSFEFRCTRRHLVEGRRLYLFEFPACAGPPVPRETRKLNPGHHHDDGQKRPAAEGRGGSGEIDSGGAVRAVFGLQTNLLFIA